MLRYFGKTWSQVSEKQDFEDFFVLSIQVDVVGASLNHHKKITFQFSERIA